MYRKWGGEAEFFVVYIREAHPWSRKTKKKGKTILPEPSTLGERQKHGQICRNDLKLSIPMLLDGMDNKAGEAYAAWPDRIYVVDRAGRIAFRGGPGPFGFRPADAEKSLRMLLGRWPGIL